jgi:thiamine kinase-like enzyme
MEDTLFQHIQSRIPNWRAHELEISPLAGGITNRNYKVVVGREAFVVRICAPNVAIHGVDRQVEQRCAHAAAAIGVAPPVIAFLDDLPGGEQVLVTRFIDGVTLQAEEVRSPARIPRIAALLRRFHGLAEFAGHFDVFRVFERGLFFCRKHGAPLPPLIDQVAAEMHRIEAALRHHDQPLVACHNDLLPANLIEEQDGRLWLLDWEYAGWSRGPFFDLGNLSVNNRFSDDEDTILLNAYWGAVTPVNWAHLKLMKIVSDAREGIWGMVQTVISQLEFDFAGYGTRHLTRFMTHAADSQLDTWLADAQHNPLSK